MQQNTNGPLRAKIMVLVFWGTMFVWIFGLQLQGSISAQAAQSSLLQSNFMGKMPSVVDSAAVRTLRLRFPAGTRTNWHSHTWGQLLMVEEGCALTQVRGGPVVEYHPGQPWFTEADVEHWHGAAPDMDLLQLTAYEGTVKWLEPVTDREYKASPCHH